MENLEKKYSMSCLYHFSATTINHIANLYQTNVTTSAILHYSYTVLDKKGEKNSGLYYVDKKSPARQIIHIVLLKQKNHIAQRVFIDCWLSAIWLHRLKETTSLSSVSPGILCSGRTMYIQSGSFTFLMTKYGLS